MENNRNNADDKKKTNKSLKMLTTFGVLWNGLSQFLIQSSQFIVITILARLLSPKDFGIVGMAMIFTGFVTAINELGMSAAIIQRKDINNVHLSTSFWTNIGIGTILFILTILISPLVAEFFQEDLVRPILVVSSICLVTGSFSMVQRALLEKNLNFKNITKVEVCAAIGSGIISIFLALKGFGAWSLVFGTISGSIISAILLWKLSKWRPSLIFSITHFKELFNFGGHVVGSQLLGNVAMRIDYIIVGKLLGTVSLGYYSLARMLTSFPTQKISGTIMRVIFPAFSTIQENNNILKEAYLKVTKYTSLVTFPMLGGMFVVAPEFVVTIYGEKWSPMIILIQIFCLKGAISSINTLTSTIQYSKGRSDIQFKCMIFSTIMITIAVLIGAKYGIIGITIMLTITTVLLAIIIQYITNKLINLDMYTYIKETIPAIICSTILIGIVEIYKNMALINDLTYIFLSSVFLGIVTYLILIWIFYNSIFKEMKLLVYGTR